MMSLPIWSHVLSWVCSEGGVTSCLAPCSFHGVPEGGGCPDCYTPHVNRITHDSENITFPQLCWWAVIFGKGSPDGKLTERKDVFLPLANEVAGR